MITPTWQPGATISAVKIRAVTLGLDLPVPEVVRAPLVAAGRFLAEARRAFGAEGLEVQTTRLAGASARRQPPPGRRRGRADPRRRPGRVLVRRPDRGPPAVGGHGARLRH